MKKNNKYKGIKVQKIDFEALRDAGFEEYVSSIDYTDKELIKEILIDFFIAGEHDSFIEVVELYIHNRGKREVSKKTKIPERTIYNLIDKKHSTSSKNLFKIMQFICEDDQKVG